MPLLPADYRKTAQTHRRGTRADQPAATTVLAGTIYYVTDEGALERSTGAAWESYSSSGVSRVVATGQTRTIANTMCLVVSSYFAVEGTGSLVLEGDADLVVL